MKRATVFFLCIIIVLNTAIECLGAKSDTVDGIIAETMMSMYKNVPNPQIGSVGGEWAVLGLARGTDDISEEYFQNYFQNVKNKVLDLGGVLNNRKYTEYSRVVVALSSIGKNPENIGGFNLLTPLGDYEKVVFQGINGPVWALIALDSQNYEMPKNYDATLQATRDMYVNYILDAELSDGGWSLSSENADTDITAMVLQALSKYQNKDNVNTAIEKALVCLSDLQNENASFSDQGVENAESCAQVIVALTELGISPNDTRFVKNGRTVTDALIDFYRGDGEFLHSNNGSSSQIATEQALYALVAEKRFFDGKTSLYTMSDVKLESKNDNDDIEGLPNKNEDVHKKEIILAEKSFLDVKNHENQAAIEALAKREIINGKSYDEFCPNDTMTRAEFATIITNSLGLSIKGANTFFDVNENDWFFDFVNTAFSYGIIKGVGENKFNPDGLITREEAVVMVSRAANLCGINMQENVNFRDVLAPFSDYVIISDWAIDSFCFCLQNGIILDDKSEINPQENVTRAEIAQMVYNMLSKALLL